MFKYSICIPAYKTIYLEECIKSILSQTYPNFEIIVVDDASPHDIKSIINLFKDNRIHYFRNEINYGALNVVDNWNKCINYASGDYLICMGDDDMLFPAALEQYELLINDFPDLDIYHGRTMIIDEDSKFLDFQESRPLWESVYSMIWHEWNCNRIQYIGDFLYKLDSLKKNGGFYKLPFAQYSDYISSVQAAKNKGIANSQNFVFKYRRNRNNISSNGNSKILFEAVLKAKRYYVDFFKVDPENEIDKKYRMLLLAKADSYFDNLLLSLVRGDLSSGKLKSLYYWLHNIKKFGYRRRDLLMLLKKIIVDKI